MLGLAWLHILARLKLAQTPPIFVLAGERTHIFVGYITTVAQSCLAGTLIIY
jgi:hypothetical protein